jgi:1-acyl-sn-glycerol-3-phosphate acyltransferase
MASQRQLFQYHKNFMNTYMRLLTRFNAVQETQLPEQPLIFASNHPTTTDPFLLPLLVNDPIHILVIETAFEIPVLGKLITQAGHHRVSRVRASGGKLIDQALNSLQNGNHVGIFPEGELSNDDGSMRHAHAGAARIALLSGAPVVPVGIYTSPDSCLVKTLKDFPDEPPLRWVTHGSYYMTVGKPMQFIGDGNDYAQVEQATQKIASAIQAQAQKSRRRMQLSPSRWGVVYRMLRQVEAIFS